MTIDYCDVGVNACQLLGGEKAAKTGAEDYYGELGIYPSSNSRIALSSAMTRKISSLPAVADDILWTYGIRSDYWTRGAILNLEWIMERWEGVSVGAEEETLLTFGIKFPL